MFKLVEKKVILRKLFCLTGPMPALYGYQIQKGLTLKAPRITTKVICFVAYRNGFEACSKNSMQPDQDLDASDDGQHFPIFLHMRGSRKFCQRGPNFGNVF